MKRRVLAVCDREADYAQNLAAWLEGRGRLPFEYMAFTGAEKLCGYASQHPVELLLVGGNTMCPGIEELPVGKLIILSEEDTKECGGYPSVFKYQSCMKILQEVAALYGEKEAKAGERPVPNRKLRIYGVCSPLGRSGKTSFALAAGQLLAQKSPALYLNLEAYSGFEELFSCSYERSIGDLFYTIRQGKGNTAVQMAGIIQEIGRLHYLPPVISPDDMEEIGEGEWDTLLGAVRGESVYESVILDFGAAFGRTFGLLEQCGRIYVPVLEDKVSMAKMRQFEGYLGSTAREDILKKMEKIHLPAPLGFWEGHPWPECLMYGKFGEAVRKIMDREGMG